MAMSKPFDATMRKLIELEPAAWLRFLHISVSDPSRVMVIDSNLSTVTAEADRVLWVDEPAPWIEHVELQAARDLELPDRLHWYSTLLRRSRKVPVHTTIILLRPVADGPELSGTLEFRNRHGEVYDWFGYDIVRVWQQPVDEVLAAGLPVLPLAPVSRVTAEKVHEVLVAISERLIRETSPEQAATIWAATKVLMGLRYSIEQVDEMVRGISTMILGIRGIEESSVYQDIFAKGEAKGLVDGLIAGRIEEARQAVLQVGRKKLDQPDDEIRERIAAIDNVDRLNALLERIFDVSSWDELLSFNDPPA
jgi:predicted transposase YdaD